MTNPDDDVDAIAAIRQAIEVAENIADADAVAAYLTDDAALMMPDFPVQEGKAACARFMRDVMTSVMSRFDRHITYESAEVAVIGEMAFDRGTFSFTVSPKAGGDAERVTGKYLWLLKRTAGTWRIARLIVSRDDEDEAETQEPGVVEFSKRVPNSRWSRRGPLVSLALGRAAQRKR